MATPTPGNPYGFECVTGSTSPLQKTGIRYGVRSLNDSMAQDYSNVSSTHSVLCCVAYEDSDLFLAEMLGYSFKSGGDLIRVLPETSGWDALTATDTLHYALDAKLVESIGFDGPDSFSGWPTYKQLVYRVTFGAPLYNVLEDYDVIFYEHERNVVWTKHGQAQNEKIPGAGFKFPSDQTQLSEVGVLTGRTLSIQAKWLNVPFVNYAKLSQLANKVNVGLGSGLPPTGPLIFDGIKYPPETVLFETWSEEKIVDAFGSKQVNLTFNFLVRIDGRTWNAFWRRVRTAIQDPPGSGIFTTIPREVPTADGTLGGTKVFRAADLNECFSLS